MTGADQTDTTGRCPTPWKRAHLTESAAARQMQSLMDNRSRIHTKRLHHYLCRCGRWHIGNRSSMKGARR